MTQLRGNDLATLRRINSRAMLAELAADAEGQYTVTELAERVELSRPTVEAGLSDLVGDGWVVEVDRSATQKAGRPARRYQFKADAGLVMGIDIGPHTIVGLLADLSGAVLHTEHRGDVDLLAGDAAWEAIDSVIRRSLDAVGASPASLLAITVGVPAIVDLSDEIAVTTVVPDWLEAGIPARIRSAYPAASTFFDNDAKLATLAEAEWGNIAGAGNALFILVGRRVAAGLVVDGRLVRGSRGAAGELGALTRVGWISAYDRFLSAGPNSAGAGNTEAIISSALRGDPDAERALADFAENIAEGVAALVLTIDPEVVVVGGGFSRAGELLLTPLRAAIAPLTIYSPEVMLSSLGSNAIALGAVARSLAHVRVAAMDLPS